MSFELSSKAWNVCNISMTEKMVLLAICNRHNDNRGCFPSHATLAKDCCANEKTIRNAIKSLCDKKLIEKTNRINPDTGGLTSNSYKILYKNFDTVTDAIPTVTDAEGYGTKFRRVRNNIPKGTVTDAEKPIIKPVNEPVNEPTLPPTPLAGDSGGVCLEVFYKGNCKDKFKGGCLAIARGKRFSNEEAEKHFTDFENYWLSPALPASKANKKNWQRAFLNWIAKSKPTKINNFDVADEILGVAKRKLEHLLDYENEDNKIDSNLVFLKALKSYTKQQIYNVLADIINSPPKNKIHSWGIIFQYL
jgi:hypothetical protein